MGLFYWDVLVEGGGIQNGERHQKRKGSSYNACKHFFSRDMLVFGGVGWSRFQLYKEINK